MSLHVPFISLSFRLHFLFISLPSFPFISNPFFALSFPSMFPSFSLHIVASSFSFMSHPLISPSLPFVSHSLISLSFPLHFPLHVPFIMSLSICAEEKAMLGMLASDPRGNEDEVSGTVFESPGRPAPQARNR